MMFVRTDFQKLTEDSLLALYEGGFAQDSELAWQDSVRLKIYPWPILTHGSVRPANSQAVPRGVYGVFAVVADRARIPNPGLTL